MFRSIKHIKEKKPLNFKGLETGADTRTRTADSLITNRLRL